VGRPCWQRRRRLARLLPVADGYYEFAAPLMQQGGYLADGPTITRWAGGPSQRLWNGFKGSGPRAVLGAARRALARGGVSRALHGRGRAPPIPPCRTARCCCRFRGYSWSRFTRTAGIFFTKNFKSASNRDLYNLRGPVGPRGPWFVLRLNFSRSAKTCNYSHTSISTATARRRSSTTSGFLGGKDRGDDDPRGYPPRKQTRPG